MLMFFRLENSCGSKANIWTLKTTSDHYKISVPLNDVLTLAELKGGGVKLPKYWMGTRRLLDIKCL